MITLVVWSKDRACQLDCLLQSIERFAPNTFSVCVVAKSSNDIFREAYDQVFAEHKVLAIGHETNGDFHYLTNQFINLAGEQIAFSTDDTILYREPETPILEAAKCASIFSLRYGLNTIVQDYHTGRKQPILRNPARHPSMPDVIAWAWRHYHPLNNYGYPFGLDLHIYNTKMLKDILRGAHYDTSNQLETLLFEKRDLAPPFISSYDTSVAVNVPVNNMSGITRGGEDYGYTIEELNNRYLAGMRIDLDDLCSHEIVGSHQELPLHFTLEKRDNG